MMVFLVPVTATSTTIPYVDVFPSYSYTTPDINKQTHAHTEIKTLHTYIHTHTHTHGPSLPP